MPILLDNVSVDTVSANFSGRGGSHIVIIRGDDFGGGTVDIQIASVNDNVAGPRFAVIEDASFTANGSFKLDYLPSGYLIRAELSGSTSPVNVFVEVS